jgi:hypothetical protein
MAEGIDEQNRKHAVETVPGEQGWNGKDADQRSGETSVGQAVRPDFDE